MGNKVSSNQIINIDQDCGKDISNGLPYSGNAVQNFIKTTFKQKIGYLRMSNNVNASNLYHLLGFATKEDYNKYASDPVANNALLLVDQPLVVSTVQDIRH